MAKKLTFTVYLLHERTHQFKQSSLFLTTAPIMSSSCNFCVEQFFWAVAIQAVYLDSYKTQTDTSTISNSANFKPAFSLNHIKVACIIREKVLFWFNVVHVFCFQNIWNFFLFLNSFRLNNFLLKLLSQILEKSLNCLNYNYLFFSFLGIWRKMCGRFTVTVGISDENCKLF
jgi:hypothetical protein